MSWLLDKRVLLVVAAAIAVVIYLRRPIDQSTVLVMLMNQRVVSDTGVVRVTVAVMNESVKTLSHVSVRCVVTDPNGAQLGSKTVEVQDRTIEPGYRGEVEAIFNLEGRVLGNATCEVIEAR